MQKQFIVDDTVPLPARNLGAVVQSVLRVSKKIAADLIHHGHVKVNGRIRNQTHSLIEVNEAVEINYQPQPVARNSLDRGQARFEIVHEDASILVVLKPPNLLTVPTPHREANTLLSQITRHLSHQTPAEKAFCVHRLDRGVSGLLVFAKSLEVAQALRDQFSQRKPQRQYVAIVAGSLANPQGTFRSHLATDSDLNRYSTDNEEAGQLAITHYRVRESWDDVTMVEIWLETGRRNQIRVHFAEVDHPVLGDPRYQRQRATHPAWPYKRLALHAESLGFTHPVSGEAMQFRSSWPDEFRQFKRHVQKGRRRG